MRKSLTTAALCTGLIMLAVPANAAVMIFGAVLSGAQESSPNDSLGTGTAVVTLDDAAKTLRVQTTFSGLTGLTTAAHIHCCAGLGLDAGVATQVPTFTGFPAGTTAGSYDQTFDMTLASSWNPAFITNNGGTVDTAFLALRTGMLAELSYLNIHTDVFPRGEIRGQLAAIPEPATWGLMIAGFGAVGAAMRRRRVAVRYA